ncbi:MAG: pyridoxal-phosphate dependent enzyme [Myxococcales bacterium]|nr:pyridoxal-phosphate dependent enzyme [Myxococcales bacterium]
MTSFKIRGVFNAVACLSPEERAKGLSTVSAGNTAQALAWVGRYFGVSSRSLMPDTAPGTKIDAVKQYGGEPVLVPIAEIFRFLKERAWEHQPFAFIHPWTNRNVMIGHGTIGLEIAGDLPEVSAGPGNTQATEHDDLEGVRSPLIEGLWMVEGLDRLALATGLTPERVESLSKQIASDLHERSTQGDPAIRDLVSWVWKRYLAALEQEHRALKQE